MINMITPLINMMINMMWPIDKPDHNHVNDNQYDEHDDESLMINMIIKRSHHIDHKSKLTINLYGSL